MRHTPTKKADLDKETQIALGLSGTAPFSVGRSYSLMGCSPAEPISACNGKHEIKTCHKQLTRNVFHRLWSLGR